MLSLEGRDRTRGLWNAKCQDDSPFCLSFGAVLLGFCFTSEMVLESELFLTVSLCMA